MQYRLSTLMILMGIGPPLLAVLWWFTDSVATIIGLAAFGGFFGVWYWMLCKSQASPALRGKPNYDPPLAPPPGV